MNIKKIFKIFEDILDIKKGVISHGTKPSDIDEWDSIATVNIIVALEDEFNIKFKLKDLQKLRDVQDFIKLVEKYKL
ncbi:acyl carrier protein [Candidatus Pelagibacter sp.]|nr:acyl carrier protein [Candidatus Pelagibacter sp.]